MYKYRFFFGKEDAIVEKCPSNKFVPLLHPPCVVVAGNAGSVHVVSLGIIRGQHNARKTRRVGRDERGSWYRRAYSTRVYTRVQLEYGRNYLSKECAARQER